MNLNRRNFVVATASVLMMSTRAVAAEDTGTGLGILPELLKARGIAENDLKQVHLLAKYMAGTASPFPINLPKIDGQYNALVAAMNDWLTGLAAAIQQPRPLDSRKWLTKAEACIAQAKAFDDEVQRLRAQAGASAVRGSSSPKVAPVLEKVLLPGSAPFQTIQTTIDQSTVAQRKAAADQLQSATWKNSEAVLATGEAATAPQPTGGKRAVTGPAPTSTP
jgi:hypothetical protein